MALAIVFLIVGFVLLIKGADFFVDGASSIAGKLKVPSLIIGLTVVSMGTSAPEAAVSITSSIQGSNALSLGNVIGSNIFNLLMVVGISSVILPIMSDSEILKRDMPVNIGLTVLLFVLLLDGKLGRIDAAILLLAFAAYLFILIRSAIKNKSEGEELKIYSWTKSIIFLVIGLAGVIGGGQLVVNGATTVATKLGMSETLIGLTIVAIGTSLPELVTSVIAAKKGNSGIAMGNVVGSCIFNLVFILGLAGIIKPMASNTELLIDTGILFGICLVMFLFAITGKKTNRTEGATCVVMYAAYTAYIIMRAYHIWIF